MLQKKGTNKVHILYIGDIEDYQSLAIALSAEILVYLLFSSQFLLIFWSYYLQGL